MVLRKHVAKVSEPCNTKLGKLIHSWSIPASRTVCVGSTAACRSVCYAQKGYFRFNSNKKLYAKNLRASRGPGFARWMRGFLRENYVRILRIHVSGDFYSVAYIKKWIAIISGMPDVQFFAYTRSWRDAEMLPHLVALGKLPNMQLWWSLDMATGPAPRYAHIRQAYMAMNDLDAVNVPANCDLVFRVKPKTVLKNSNGVLVCPEENGITPGITCSKCKICWQPKRKKNGRKRAVYNKRRSVC